MITVKIDDKEINTYKTYDQSLALISAVEDKYGENAFWLENKEKSSEEFKIGYVELKENGQYKKITNEICIQLIN